MLLGFTKAQDSQENRFAPSALLTNAQMGQADRRTIDAGTDGFSLMLSAGQAVANCVCEHYPDHKVIILCGPGNNGGDGYVAGAFLEEAGKNVALFSSAPARKLKGDAKKASHHFKGKIYKISHFMKEFQETVQSGETATLDGYVVVDALYGTGFRGELDKDITALFDIIRQLKVPVVAVDVPSGIHGTSGAVAAGTLEAAHTVTFFRKKLGHCLMPAMAYCGAIHVHDIGIDTTLLSDADFAAHENIQTLWIDQLPDPDKGAHKYKRGHIAMLGGTQMTGAIRMAAQSSMRIGAGMCTIHARKESEQAYTEDVPHLIFEELPQEADFVTHVSTEKKTVLLLGPGLGREDDAAMQKIVLDVLALHKPTVLDADALSCFEDAPETLHAALHDLCVITPHEGEFKRIFPAIDGDLSKYDKAVAAAALSKAVLLYKGPDTIIVQVDEKPVLHTHASSWLATAGAGDVLAGMIAGLLGQGLSPCIAACMAAWIHGEASLRFGAGLTAPDIIAQIPSVLRDLHQSKRYY